MEFIFKLTKDHKGHKEKFHKKEFVQTMNLFALFTNIYIYDIYFIFHHFPFITYHPTRLFK